MKKFLLITTILFCLLIGGCLEENEQVSYVEETTINFEQSTYEEFIDNLPLLPESELQQLNEYRKEVLRRIEEETFLSQQEKEILEENGYRGSDRFWERTEEHEMPYLAVEFWYAPIIYKDNNNDIILLVTNGNNGDVYQRRFDNNYDFVIIGNIHKDERQSRKLYELARGSLVEYDSENGKINIWTYGQLEKCFTLPENSKFVGKEEVGKFYFREKSQVYRFSYEEDWTYSLIADGVKEVVVTNYYFNVSYRCQPLFLMEDGTLKVYIEIEGVESNIKECLQPILDDGGYRYR